MTKILKNASAAAGFLAVLGIATIAAANPTQEEVFQSINDNVGSTVDLSKAVPYLLVLGGIIIMAVLINYHLKHRTVPRKKNNPAKLAREMCRQISLRPVELKQLKLMAADQNVEYPLTLILCPSLLGKAIRSPNVRVDREVVRQMVQKLRKGLVEKGE